VGGTGKTPLVEFLARWFRRHDVRVTLISRGYAAQCGARNDEALELEQRLPDVPHLQNPDRVEAAQTAIVEFECQLILLDDAFQHRRIARDLDIVLIDAAAPFGFDHVLPRGLLREPLSGLRRADIVALSRADMIEPDRREAIRDRVRRYAPEAAWLELVHRPRALLSAGGEETPVDALVGKRVAAFCGIGNPAGFEHTLKSCGMTVAALREFPDHHDYSKDDVQSLIEWAAAQSDIAAVVCTHKDLVKLEIDELGSLPLWAVTIGLDILAGHEEFEARLQQIVEQIK